MTNEIKRRMIRYIKTRASANEKFTDAFSLSKTPNQHKAEGKGARVCNSTRGAFSNADKTEKQNDERLDVEKGIRSGEIKK